METQLLALMALVFVSVAMAAVAALSLLTRQDPLRQRLATVAAPGVSTTTPESLLDDGVTGVVKRVRSFVPKSPKEMRRVERLLAGAGYYGPWPATLFAAAQLLLPLALFAASITFFGRSGSWLLLAAFLAAVGYFLPTLWLERAIEARRREIRNGLPDAIDLLIVCIESGSGLDQALAKVAEELSLAYPALARELEMIGSETRAGKPRLEAFKNFAERTKVDDVRSLVAMLVQTDRFGTSVGQALRTHAEVSRTKRRQRAEEKAAKLGVKLLFPLVFCLFPAFYVIVLGPAFIRIYRHFVGG